LEGYAIAAHGIKGASFGVCANDVGMAAERLERMAKAADEKEKVQTENDIFIKNLEELLDSIDAALIRYDSKNRKTSVPVPNLELLKELSGACLLYNMDKIDDVLSQLENFEYESGAELIAWLRKQVDHMNLDEIGGVDWAATLYAAGK